MNGRDNPAWIMCNQIMFECEKKRRSDIIRKAVSTCSNTGLPIPDETYYELLAEGVYHGPACNCNQCRKANEAVWRKFK